MLVALNWMHCSGNCKDIYEQTALRAFAQDVAAVVGAGGSRLQLDLCLLWLAAADYTLGSPSTGIGSSNLSASQFTTKVQLTVDKVLPAVADVKRSDGGRASLFRRRDCARKSKHSVVPLHSLPELCVESALGRLTPICLPS